MIIEILICGTWLICGIIALSSHKKHNALNSVLCGAIISMFLFLLSWPVSAGIVPMVDPLSCGNVLETHKLQEFDGCYATEHSGNNTVVFKYDDTIFTESNCVIVDISETDIQEPVVLKCSLKHSPWVSWIFSMIAPDYFIMVAPRG